MFLNGLKRYSRNIIHNWGVSQIEDHFPRPELIKQLTKTSRITINSVTQLKEPKASLYSKKLPGIIISYSITLLFISLPIATIIGVALYQLSKIFTYNLVSIVDEDENYRAFLSISTGIINLIGILFVSWMYHPIAKRLTEMECNRTQTEFERSLSIKLFLLEFVNCYSALVFMILMKGNSYLSGHPGNHQKILCSNLLLQLEKVTKE